jgi:hypothetical protein
MADMTRNPLTARVIVNRLWHHLFGRGLVATTDNFGKLGDLPTHPELLDHLAQRFIASGGSIKSLLRDILLSDTFQRSANASDIALKEDPENKLLSHWRIRRLEAEAIRDSILTLSGKFDPTLYGESVTSAEPRRSIYLKVIRNALDPFLTTFDAPVPFATRGNRDTTNVPAQSLTLLNDPLVIAWSSNWAQRTAPITHDAERIRQMFRQAFYREPSNTEVEQSLAYLATLQAQSTAEAQKLLSQEKELTALEHQITSILNPAREKLLTSKPSALRPSPSAPVPLAEWTFDKDLSDTQNKLPLSLTGNARIENGALILDGQSMAQSDSLPKNLQAKTLEAWIQLDNLTQQGGGALTVQSKNGSLFDAIVFGEKKPAHWVAGSDHFTRSELLDAPPETEATHSPIHIAITHQPDGTTTVYRAGEPYGQTYRKAPAATFPADSSQVLLGSRHGAPTGNKGLTGRIFRARLYDRALTPEEITHTARIESTALTEADVLAALTPDQRSQITRLQSQRDELAEQVSTTRASSSNDPPELQAWTSLAQSLINLKEFIYLQ